MRRGWLILVPLLLANVAGADQAERTARQGSGGPSSGPARQRWPRSAREVEAALRALDAEQVELQRQRDAIAAELEVIRSRRVVAGRAYVRLARAGLLPVGGGFAAFVDHASRLERLRRTLARDLNREEALSRQRVAVGKRNESLAARREPLQVQQETWQQSRAATLVATDRELAFQQAFSGSVAGQHTAVYGGGIGPSEPSRGAGGFAQMQGRLPFPIPGRAEILQVERRGAGGPGLEMHVPAGTTVRAVYSGRVAFADRYGDYGMTVIIDHGNNYFTVSANLAATFVRAGDEVTVGSRLGTVAGAEDGAHLYFELRRGADLVAPARWFGI